MKISITNKSGKVYEYEKKSVFIEPDFHKQLKLTSTQEDKSMGQMVEYVFKYWKDNS